VSQIVHAGCVALAGRAVLIRGPSGSGKSDLALRLIDRGWVLVSDDYTSLSEAAGRLMASPPATIAGKIELRGVGILERPYRAEVPVALLVDLAGPPERMPEADTAEYEGVTVPMIGLSALEASAPIKVEAALHLHGSTLP
jgi:serine kinase of HPr protein (carbohydrate metabolism regulator)